MKNHVELSAIGSLTSENPSSFRKALEIFIDKDGKVKDLLPLLADCICFDISLVHIEEDLKDLVLTGYTNQRMYIKEMVKNYKRTLDSLRFNTHTPTYELCTPAKGLERTLICDENKADSILLLLEAIDLDGHIVGDLLPEYEEEVIENPTWPAFERFAIFIEKYNYERIVMDFIKEYPSPAATVAGV